MKKLGDLFHFINGRGFKKTEWKESGLPIIRIQNLNNHNAEFNYFKGTYDKKIEINNGDLLFSWSGTVGTSFGPHIWYRDKGLLNQHIFKLEFKENIDRDFAFHSLKFITSEIEKHVNGAAGLVHITKDKLNNFEIPLPPLAEQKRIVTILDEAFIAIAKAKENAERNLKNSKELFESFLQEVFDPSTRSGQGWREVTLGEVCENMITGPFGSMLHKSDYIDNGIPVVNPQNIIDGKIVSLQKTMIDADKYSSLKKYSLKLGDIIIARRGEMGRCAIVEIENVGWLCGTGSFVLRLNKNIADIQFINIILSSNSVKKELEKTSIGATMSNLNQTILSNLKFSIPSFSEQRKIVQKLDSLSAETKRLEAIYQSKIESLDELKKAILQKAFSGELTERKVVV